MATTHVVTHPAWGVRAPTGRLVGRTVDAGAGDGQGDILVDAVVLGRGGATEHVHPWSMELGQRIHDDADEGQIETRDPGLDLGVAEARVKVVATQQVTHHVDDVVVETRITGNTRSVGVRSENVNIHS